MFAVNRALTALPVDENKRDVIPPPFFLQEVGRNMYKLNVVSGWKDYVFLILNNINIANKVIYKMGCHRSALTSKA